MRITVLCFCSIIWTSNLLIVENLKGYEEICSAPVNQAAAESNLIILEPFIFITVRRFVAQRRIRWSNLAGHKTLCKMR
jgi:hypothetical protein